MPGYLVTGGAGFIGSNLVAALARAGERVVALDDLSTGRWAMVDRLLGASDAPVERHTASVLDARAVATAMRGVDVVFHQAGLTSVQQSIEDPLGCEDVNVRGLLVVLEAARHAGVKRVVFASSSAVYGDDPALPKTETSPTRPLSPYAASKLSGEVYLGLYARLYGLETIAFRNFNVFGRNQLPEGPYAAAIPRFVWAWLNGRPATIYGDGLQTRDFAHVDDVVRANLLAASSGRRFDGDVVNIGGGSTITLLDVLHALRAMGLSGDVIHEPPRQGDVRHSRADVSKARDVLGFVPQVPWRQGLSSTVAFLEDHLGACIGE